MRILPPEKNPLNYPRDPSRSMARDTLIFLATLVTIAIIIAIPLAIMWPMRHLGWGYVWGLVIGGAVTAIYVRVAHGHWP